MKVALTSGYSDTPLAKKLGIRECSFMLVSGAPADYRKLLQPLPCGAIFEDKPGAGTDIAHVFDTEQQELTKFLGALRKKLKPEAIEWIS